MTEVPDLNGFARVAGSAVSPKLLERVLMQRDGSLPLPQAHGLVALDRLAEPGEALDQLVATRSSWLVHEVDKDLGLALGLDQATTAGKFRAIVARAYIRGWCYADKAGATRAAEGRAASNATVLWEILSLMTFGRREPIGPADFSVVDPDHLLSLSDDFHLLTTNGRSEVIERQQCMDEMFRILAHMEQAFKGRATSAGRPFHEELFFFAVCLGEAFTILTGLKPIFDHSFRKRSDSPDWRGFLDAAFVLCGLASPLSKKAIKDGGHGSAVQGMPGDILTDKLRFGPPRAGIWCGNFEHLAADFAKPWRRLRYLGGLYSTGLELDYEKVVPELGQLACDTPRIAR